MAKRLRVIDKTYSFNKILGDISSDNRPFQSWKENLIDVLTNGLAVSYDAYIEYVQDDYDDLGHYNIVTFRDETEKERSKRLSRVKKVKEHNKITALNKKNKKIAKLKELAEELRIKITL